MTSDANRGLQAQQPVDLAIIGLGYIGLPTAAVAAMAGMRVVGVDISSSVVETVNSGGIHIEEPQLDLLVRQMVAEGRLTASQEIPAADVYIIAVPTPCDEANQPDTTAVLSAARALSAALRPGNLVILESTSPVGTTEMVCAAIANERPDLLAPTQSSTEADFSLAYCPERVLPGRIMAELIQNDRCVGGISKNCGEAAAAFYRRFVEGECVSVAARAAEMVKLAENSFRDVNIAFANELSLAADALDIDVWEVIRIANRHPRVNILQPGPGVGGHCIAVDPWFLVHSAPEVTPLIRTARQVNDGKCEHVVHRALAMVAAQPSAYVACLGLAFKADVDDFRESPALKIAARLSKELGSRLMIVEPHARELPGELARTGARLTELSEALQQAQIIILLVDHREFVTIDRASLSGKSVYDTRGCLPKLAN